MDEIPEMNELVVRSLIHQKLDEIRNGELFVPHDLKDDAVDKLLGDAAMYKKFESIIGKTWMDIDMVQYNESGLNGGKLNRKKKMYTKALKSHSTFVREQIEHYIMQRSGGFSADDGKDDNDDFDGVEEDTVSSLSDSKISRSSASQKRKKKKKSKKKKHKDKKKSKKRKKRQSYDSDDDMDLEDHDNEDIDSMSAPTFTKREEKRLRRRLEKAKVFFETEREQIMKQIPANVKKDFRTLGFSKWGKDYLPCMQLGPYDVGPGGVRDKWMEMFSNTMESKRPLTRLIFWYGTPEDDLSNGFSFIPQSKFISWEQGCKNKYDKIPSRINKKIDNGKNLSASDDQIITGLEQINADAKLEKDERSPWLFEYEEDYEDYFDQIDDETSVEENEISVEAANSSEESGRKKKKKSQKSKKEKMDKSQKSRKEKTDKEKERESKKKKRKRKSDSGSDEASKKKKSKSTTLDEVIEQEVAEEDAMMELEDSSTNEDELDDDFNDIDSASDEELYQDPDVFMNKKLDPAKSKSKSKSKSNPKSKVKAQVLKSPEDIEQELFEECEKIFLPMMAKLRETDDKVVTEKFLRKIDRDVQKLTPAFFRTHQIGLVVKEKRSQFKENAQLNRFCKQITSKMKKVFHEKLSTEPEGFQPKVKKIVKKQLSTKKKPEITAEQRNESPTPDKKEIYVPRKINKLQKPVDDVSNHSHDSKKEIVETPVEEQKPIVKTPKQVKPKAPRKSFSLAGMIERKPSNTTNADASTVSIEKDSDKDTPNEAQEKTQQPQWTVNYQPSGPNSYEKNPDRVFAMEFLMDAVSCLPTGKVDPKSIALALEDTLYTKYEGEHDRYMERLHDVCAAIAGKKQMGPMAQKIIDGKYATPLDVINIPQKMMFHSFEGFWIP